MRLIKLLAVALLLGMLATLGTASILAFYDDSITKDAELWAVWIPAGVCGAAAVVVVICMHRFGEPISGIWRSLQELWEEITKTPF